MLLDLQRTKHLSIDRPESGQGHGQLDLGGPMTSLHWIYCTMLLDMWLGMRRIFISHTPVPSKIK